MSVELEARIYEPFTLSALLGRTTELARTVLPHVPIAMIGPPADYIRHDIATPVPAEMLAAVCGPGAPTPPDVLIVGGDGVVDVACYDTNYPPDEPEGGIWIVISAAVVRGPASRLLAALTATAAAQLGRAEVVDDYDILGPRRLTPPDSLAAALHRAAGTAGTAAPAGTDDYADAVFAALRPADRT